MRSYLEGRDTKTERNIPYQENETKKSRDSLGDLWRKEVTGNGLIVMPVQLVVCILHTAHLFRRPVLVFNFMQAGWDDGILKIPSFENSPGLGAHEGCNEIILVVVSG